MSTPTKEDAALFWEALGSVLDEKVQASTQALFTDAIAAAGIHTRRTMSNLREDGYRFSNSDGIPDHRYTCAQIARFLINDLYNANDTNDRHIANDRGYAVSDRAEARKRNDARTVLSQTIARLNDADFRALVDSLAGITETSQAA